MEPSLIYAYLPLDRPQKEIRLIEILQTSPEIRCRLTKASLLNSPIFCALSYVWGTSQYYEKILVNNISFTVTKSLADALRHIPTHLAEAFPGKDTISMRLWADALCINQADIIEKGHQVPLMKDIYSSAKVTFCSLDSISSPSNIPAAIEYVSEMSGRLEKECTHLGSAGRHAASTILDTLPPRQFYASATGAHEIVGNEALSGAPVNIIQNLSSLPYWRRAWIVQELVLSNEVILYYGSHSINFERLERLINWAYYTEQSLTAATLPNTQHWILKILNQFTTVLQVHILREARALENSPDLHFVGLWAVAFRATNPKDHVYAFLGMANLEIEPRYHESIPVADVYIEFCKAQVLNADACSTEPLLYLKYGGLANGNPGKFGLPTWVPNFPSCAEYGCGMVQYLPDTTKKIKRWNNCVGRLQDIHIHDRSLLTTFLPIDSISDISPALYNRTHDSADFLQHVYRMLNDALQVSGRPSHIGSHPFFKLASAFWHAKVPSPVWSSVELLRVARMFFLLHLLTLQSNCRYMLDFGDFNNNICCFEADITTDKSLSETNALRETWEDVCRFTEKGIRVARTARNEFALVPPTAQLGERIVLLTGCRDLSVIRKVEDHYIYIGQVGFANEIVDKRINEHNGGPADLERIELR